MFSLVLLAKDKQNVSNAINTSLSIMKYIQYGCVTGGKTIQKNMGVNP